MAKAKKEFKARVRKVRKHLDILRSIQAEIFGEGTRRSEDVIDVLNSLDDSTRYLEEVASNEQAAFLHPDAPQPPRPTDTRGIAN